MSIHQLSSQWARKKWTRGGADKEGIDLMDEKICIKGGKIF